MIVTIFFEAVHKKLILGKKKASKYLIVSGYLQRDCLGGWDVVKAALWGELSWKGGKI